MDTVTSCVNEHWLSPPPKSNTCLEFKILSCFRNWCELFLLICVHSTSHNSLWCTNNTINADILQSFVSRTWPITKSSKCGLLPSELYLLISSTGILLKSQLSVPKLSNIFHDLLLYTCILQSWNIQDHFSLFIVIFFFSKNESKVVNTLWRIQVSRRINFCIKIILNHYVRENMYTGNLKSLIVRHRT